MFDEQRTLLFLLHISGHDTFINFVPYYLLLDTHTYPVYAKNENFSREHINLAQPENDRLKKI